MSTSTIDDKDNTKKRRLNEVENACIFNDKKSITNNDSPLVYLNVGGAQRNVRRSILKDLRDASGNPLCDVLLLGPEHWSNVPTIKTDNDSNTIRIYLDRNPMAFDDLLEYIEYGKLFLEEIFIEEKDHQKNGGTRMKRLRLECDYFTVSSFSKDVDEVMYGEPISFRSDGWYSICSTPLRRNNKITGWTWSTESGNREIAKRNTKDPLGHCTVETTGMYLVFFSLQSAAVTALAPSEGYNCEQDDEFCKLGIFRDVMTTTESGHWTYPIARCGAFDYRSDVGTRKDDPLVFTASSVEPILLRKGNVLYCEHGTGVAHNSGQRIGTMVDQHSMFREEPGCANFIKLVRIFGSENILQWNVKRDENPNSEPSTVRWIASSKNTSPAAVYFDDKDETKIWFKKAGHYLLLGRIAGRLKKNHGDNERSSATIQLELLTNGGIPLHTSPVVSYPGYGEIPYIKTRVDYGHINDIIYAESESFIRVKATGGACFSQHGSVPVTFGKIPTQSLNVLRLDPSARIDRYKLSIVEYNVSCERALGEGDDDSTSLKQEPLFTVDDEGELTAVQDFQCMIVGSLSSCAGRIVTLSKNFDPFLHSQVCKESDHGSHSLTAVLTIEKDDCIMIKCRGGDGISDHIFNVGSLVFVVL